MGCAGREAWCIFSATRANCKQSILFYPNSCIQKLNASALSQVALKSSGQAAKWGVPIAAFACLAMLFAFGTNLGLAAVQSNLPLSNEEVAQGLVAPAVAVYLLQDYGTWIFAILVSHEWV